LVLKEFDSEERPVDARDKAGKPTTQMPTSEEVSICFTLSYQGDVHGRISFDGNATAKTFVIGSYFTPEGKSREKTLASNFPPTASTEGI
jgi:hypothetical protein